MFDDFDLIRRDCADRLANAARNRRSPMHTPGVVTSDIDARIMVLRDFAPASWSLRFHTDLRAPKVAAIEADPRAAVLFYDKEEKVQIRVRGRAAIESEGPVAANAWSDSSNFARRCYLGDGPGTPGDGPTSGLPPAFEGVEPDDTQLAPARENFAVLLVSVTQFDWLYLAHTGHRRAILERAGDEWKGRWVTP